MPDKVELIVGGQAVAHFLSYTVESDIYTADDAFSLELANPAAAIAEGQQCELVVNGSTELVGVIDRIVERCDKTGRTLTVEGRDLMGLLVDSCCEDFITVENVSLKTLAERLLATVPFIRRSAVAYDADAAALDSPLKFTQIDPGMTVFEALSRYAASRGLLFWAQPDGTMVFGRPKASGPVRFRIVRGAADGRRNNVIEGERTRDISRRYSKVVVIGQQQGADDIDAEAVNTADTAQDADFPFYKPYVTVDNDDAESPGRHARMVLERQRREGLTLTYTVAGHSQDGRNWAVNEMCAVRDDALRPPLDGTYLIYGRAFERSRRGTTTALRLGLPGMVQ